MPKCPKCKSSVSFSNILSLSRVSNRFLCQSCETVLEANKGVLGELGFSITTFTFLLRRNGERWFGFKNPLVLMLTVIAIFLIVYYLRSRNLVFTISRNQNKSGFLPTPSLERPELPETFTRIEYLKNRLHHKSKFELNRISTDPNREPDARQAAKQLLDERKKK